MSSVIKTWLFLNKIKIGGDSVEIPALINFPFCQLPEYIEFGVKKLSKEEKEKYRGKLKYVSSWKFDFEKVKEFIVVDLENWFLVRWA